MSADLLGAVSWQVFFFSTIVLFGWAGFMTAQALARTWRPWWHCIWYGLLLGVGDRTFEHVLFAGNLISLRGFLVDSAWIIAIMLAKHRLTLARMMVQQYPWLYEATGLFSWREKSPKGG